MNTGFVNAAVNVGASLLAIAIQQTANDLLTHRLTCFNVSAIKNASSSD
jgi:hypothetical protein